VWPDGVKFDVLLLVSDAQHHTRKNKKKGLSVSYPKLIHDMCVVHALQRVCETICVLYPNLDNLVANGKKIFVKLPAKIQLFKDKSPYTPLPPTPVFTCWGTWMVATVYYAENFLNLFSVIHELDRDNASSIAILQDIFKDSNDLKVLKTDLANIHANFNFLSQSITKLEKIRNLLSETTEEINGIQDKLNKINGPKADAVEQKFCLCFCKNNGFKVMYEILCVLEGGKTWFILKS
jgi:hypothetical protein